MARPLVLHPDRLLPADPGVRGLARSLYAHVRDLPIMHRLTEDEAAQTAIDLAYRLPKRAYRL